MLMIIGTVRLPVDRLDEARAAMEAMIMHSRGEPGCLDYAYAADILEPGLIRVSERWTDQEALDRHFASPHIATWRAAWPELGLGERSLVLYEVGGVRPI